MRSQWFESKPKAIRLRKKGVSLRNIELSMGIPRSTLSGWFKKIEIAPRHKKRLHQDWQQGLIQARKQSALWHNKQKQKRIEMAQSEAQEVLTGLNLADAGLQELALAILYLGEGKKASDTTSMGSSDPLILKFFLGLLKTLYKIDPKRIRCVLFLRVDQDAEALKRFWAKELKLPLETFVRVYKDKRTVGSKTYPHYKGVCSVDCYDVAIKRRLMFLSKMFCEQVVKNSLDV